MDQQKIYLPNDGLLRCSWPGSHVLANAYHDTEWGVPLHDDLKHFEFLLLDAFQAGLSWNTILNKRDNFRIAFDQFQIEKIANYDKFKINDLMNNQGIIRNRLKIESAVTNAQAFIKICEQYNSFDSFIWSFVDGKPIVNHFEKLSEVPAKTPVSDKMSKTLQKNGFRFVGSTICYAYMQAAGLVNDHLISCFRFDQLKTLT
jgi:DNA-3-methyladenine glycosylase I